MEKKPVIIVEAQPLPPALATVRDEVAYVLPMAIFVILTGLGASSPSYYVPTYIAKTLLAAAALIYFRRHYTKIQWKDWWLGIIVGVVVVFQWVGMETLILHYWPNYPRLSHDIFNPTTAITSPALRGAFIAIRWGGASLLVPFMEELFWRDYLWRSIANPHDFKAPSIGVRSLKAFWLVALIFGAGVHIEWMTAIVCGLIYNGLVLYTRRLGPCIIAHAVTNFLLGAYVLHFDDWRFW